jgi:4-amino-4-deoxy-L-arabinose transferase-like glycosyltransferase
MTRVRGFLGGAAAWRHSRLLSIVLAAIVALIFLAQGISAPFSKDQEPQSAQWLDDVAINGHWLLSRDYEGKLNRKPPLYFWLSAIAVDSSAREVNETNARVVSLVSGAALATMVMAWSAYYLSAPAGLLAFLFLLGSYGFSSRATTALTDMLLSFLVFAAYCIIYPQIEGRTSALRSVAAGVVLGLAVLTKGPVAIVLCALAATLYLLIVDRSWLASVIRERWWWITLAVAIAVAACWYVPAMIVGGRQFFGIQFAQEDIGHFLPKAFGGTGEAARPFYYIAVRLFGATLPLSLLIAALAVAFASGAFRREARRPILFQLSLTLAVLVLFSVASSKRDDYILPGIPGLAIAFAALFSCRDATERGAAAIVADWTAGAIAGVVLAAVAVAVVVARRDIGGFSAHLQSSDAAYLALLVGGLRRRDVRLAVFLMASAIGAVVISGGLARRRELWIGAGLAVLGLAGVSLFTGTLRPELARARTLKMFAAEARREADGSPVRVLGGPNYEMSFYYGRAVPVWNDARGTLRQSHAKTVFIAARQRDLVRLRPDERSRLKIIIRGANAGGGGPFNLYELPSIRAGFVRANRD